MRYPRVEDWNEWEILNPLHQLFLLHWNEIFDSQTPDSWQARTVNFGAIIRETISAVDTCRDFPDFKHNIPVLLEEARSIAALDPILSDHFPLAAKQLPTNPSQYTSQEPEEALDELRRRLQALHGQLGTYREALVSELRCVLDQGDARQKKRLYDLTVALATEWEVEGYSITYLAEGVDVLRDRTIGSFIARFDSFVTRYDGGTRRYKCRLSLVIPKDIAIEYLQPKEMRILRDRPFGPLLRDEQSFYGNVTDGEIFADIETASVDPVVARRAAEEKAAEFFAALNLFLHRQPDLRGRSALVWEMTSGPDGNLTQSDRPLMLPLRRFRPSGFHAVADPARQVAHYLELRGRLAAADFDQIDSSLQYHRLALQAPSDEARLVNFWIALETLCRRSRGRKSAIHSICDQIAPTVAVGNIRKLLISIASYLQSFRRATEIADLQSLFPNSPKDSISIQELLDVMVDTQRLSKLGSVIAPNPLLLFRVFKAWETISNQKALKDSLDHHKQHVDWQLRRIYRARNQVVHRGQGSLVLSRLIQHLHTYLGVTLHNLLFDLREHSAWSVPDALRHRQTVFDELACLLASKDSVPRSVLIDPAAVLLRKTGPFMWPTGS